MRISDTQLNEYISLYETSYGVVLERTQALTQLNKLISLVSYMAFPENTVKTLEEKVGKGYNGNATYKEQMQAEKFDLI